MGEPPTITQGRFLLDGEPHYRAKCPGCGVIAILDDDQYHGRVSMGCECGYHETHDLSALRAEEADDAE